MIDRAVIGRTIDRYLIGITIDRPSPSVYEAPLSQTNLIDLGLSSASIDERLIYMNDVLVLSNTDIYIYGNEDRTSASDTAVEELGNRGCVIYGNQ